jgi:hypothetical protein
MTMFAGLDVGFKRTAICVVERGEIVWRGIVSLKRHHERAGEAIVRKMLCSFFWVPILPMLI